MAPSSLKGHAGLGIYTTRGIAANDSILAAPDGPALPVIDTDHVPRKYRLAKRASIGRRSKMNLPKRCYPKLLVNCTDS
eukprot:scaffold9318_cov147-Amphora_coffeaeformis.AAC.5